MMEGKASKCDAEFVNALAADRNRYRDKCNRFRAALAERDATIAARDARISALEDWTAKLSEIDQAWLEWKTSLFDPGLTPRECATLMDRLIRLRDEAMKP